MNSRKPLFVALVLTAMLPLSPKSNGQGNSNSSAGGTGSSGGNGGNAGGASSAAPGADQSGGGAATGGTTGRGATGASGAAGTGALRASAAFELPRLKSRGSPRDGQAVPKGRATVHELSPNGKANARAAASQGVSYVDIDGGTSWASELRGAA